MAISNQNQTLIAVEEDGAGLSWNLLAAEITDPPSPDPQDPTNAAKAEAMLDLFDGTDPSAGTLETITQTYGEIPDIYVDTTPVEENDPEPEPIPYDPTELSLLAQDVNYNGAFDNGNIDINYAIISQKLKENIIINSPTDLTTFAYDLTAANQTATLNPDGSVSFQTLQNEDTFTISPPVMYDSGEKVSENIRVDLRQTQNGYIISYTPDPDWLAEQDTIYPVTLDPELSRSEYASNLVNAYVSNDVKGAAGKSAKDLIVGNDLPTVPANASKHRSFIKFKTLPTIPNLYNITSAGFNLYATRSNCTFGIFRATADWATGSNLDNLTISGSDSKYTHSPTAASYEASVGKYTGFSVLSTASGWCKGTYANHGFVLAKKDENTVGKIVFNSGDNKLYRPTLQIRYARPVNTFNTRGSNLDGYYFIKNVKSGLYMDWVNGGTSNANMQQYNSNGTAAQVFELTYVATSSSEGYYRIRAHALNSNALNRYVYASPTLGQNLTVQSPGANPTAYGYRFSFYACTNANRYIITSQQGGQFMAR